MAVVFFERVAAIQFYVQTESRKVSTVPRHREIKEFLARKICKDLEIAKPEV